ncbi:MAG: hypothetical protein DDT36_01605 [Firmicutes bacterium]|nr:hypothetical protein [Bacillota bacterium]
MLAKLLKHFVFGGEAMKPGGDQYGYVGRGVSAPNFLKQQRQGGLTGHGAGVVAGDNDYLVLSPG